MWATHGTGGCPQCPTYIEGQAHHADVLQGTGKGPLITGGTDKQLPGVAPGGEQTAGRRPQKRLGKC